MASPASASRSQSNARFTRTLLFWLALLLALAQVAAVRHAYSHNPLEAGTQSTGSKHSGGVADCGLCIVAAGIGGAAPPGASLSLPVLPQQQAAATPAIAAPLAAQQRPYAIRAPPVTAS
jgi:hypothetical protein